MLMLGCSSASTSPSHSTRARYGFWNVSRGNHGGFIEHGFGDHQLRLVSSHLNRPERVFGRRLWPHQGSNLPWFGIWGLLLFSRILWLRKCVLWHWLSVCIRVMCRCRWNKLSAKPHLRHEHGPNLIHNTNRRVDGRDVRIRQRAHMPEFRLGQLLQASV